MKAPRCQWCKRILFPWQEQRNTRGGLLHEQCARDMIHIWKEDQKRAGA
jgi:hypothetical protein